MATARRLPDQPATEARAVLEEVIGRGARSGIFAVAPDNPQDQILAALAFWSAVQGLTMLIIDKIFQKRTSRSMT